MKKQRISQELRTVIAVLRKARLRPNEVQKLLRRADVAVSRASVYRIYAAQPAAEVQP